MSHPWRYILFLVLLESCLLTYLMLSKNSITLFNVGKRDEVLVDDKLKTNTTVLFETNKYGNEHRSGSSLSEFFKKDRSVAVEEIKRHSIDPFVKVLHNRTKLNFKSKKPASMKSKGRMPRNVGENQTPKVVRFLASDNRTKTPSDEPMGIKTGCMLSFEKQSLLQARKTLSTSKSYYLFYVNIFINDISNPSDEENNILKHWQYVKKDQQFLVQLPVDFDLLTYNLLVVDKEEMVLDIKLVYENSNCSQGFSKILESVRFLLWNELFDNNTDYYLCNRNFTKESGRNWLYYLTTIWVGYDLSCSEANWINGNISTTSLKKDHLPLVTPYFCYMLALQFVWIFVLLDMKKNNVFNFDTTDDNETDQTPCYTKSDRPYGLKRFVLKLLYCKCCLIPCKPVSNMLLFMYFFILLPFGVYRTVGRHTILKKMYVDYLIVVKPSEPMFDSKNESLVFTMDILYAIIFPIFYVFLGHISYKKFLINDSQLRLWLKNDKETTALITDCKNISDRYTFQYYQFCRPLHAIFEEGKNCTLYICACHTFMCIPRLIYCLFPCIPFSCSAHNICSDCNCFCSRKIKKYRYIKRVIDLIAIFLIFPVSYLICLRPIISTFTFILRSFTYFVFVALLVRVHIMRYTLILSTTVSYFVKYFHEVVNMNAEILKHIFICEENQPYVKCKKKFTYQRKVTKIEEEMFDYVYERLMFVKKKLYFLYLKMLVVFMYIVITIMTFLSDTKSLTGSSFKDFLEFLLLIIGPYAISFFLKAYNGEFLTDENKEEIKKHYIRFKFQNVMNELTNKFKTQTLIGPLRTGGSNERTSLLTNKRDRSQTHVKQYTL